MNEINLKLLPELRSEEEENISNSIINRTNMIDFINFIDIQQRQEHHKTQDLIITSSVNLKRSNEYLLEQVKELQDQNKRQLDLLNAQENKFQMVVKELNIMKQERERKAAIKEARAKRKRQPKRQPITLDIYDLLIQSIHQKNYTSARLRIAFCLLAVTGIRVSELLPLKVSQIGTLRQSHWIAISRAKRGPSNHKAFLNKEGKRIVSDREEDFHLICMMKKSDSYIFTTDDKPDQMLSREYLTKSVNDVLRKFSKQLPENPRITSHSFRSGFITQLWRDTEDIEFVRQSIGHAKLDTTSSYIQPLSDQERQKRMLEL